MKEHFKHTIRTWLEIIMLPTGKWNFSNQLYNIVKTY